MNPVELMNKILYRVPKMPTQADIMFTNLCNLDCKMCPKYNFDLPSKHMNFKTFKKILDNLHGVKRISLIGYGEPLLNPSFFEAVRLAKGKGFHVTTVSNGHLLKSDTIFNKLVNCDIDAIRFSIETVEDKDVGGHQGDQEVLKRIAKLKEEWVKQGKQNKVIINTVIYDKTYDQIERIIGWAALCKLDMVDIAHYNRLGTKINPNMQISKELALYSKIEKANYPIRVCTLYDRYRGIRKIAFKNMTKCPMAYENVCIGVDGKVTPCICGFPTTYYGNVDDLKNVWNNNSFKIFRDNQKTICLKCTLFKLYE
ncbi:MAG: radical SAM protein [Candidatus Aenigmatarchaeota archaeon]